MSTQVCDYDHPSVFDPHFYLNSYPDLEQHGLHTKEAAAQHWCDLGVDEGRQATATFHTVQYLGTYTLTDVLYQKWIQHKNILS